MSASPISGPIIEPRHLGSGPIIPCVAETMLLALEPSDASAGTGEFEAPQVEALYRFIERTVDGEFVEELTSLAHYDESKAAIQAIVDLPDRKIDLFIRFCIQNRGRLSARKGGESVRASHGRGGSSHGRSSS